MYLVKYLNSQGGEEYRRYRDTDDHRVRAIIRSMEKRHKFRHVFTVKQF